MEKLENYQMIICEVMQPYVDIKYSNVPIKNRAAFDNKNGQYVIISEGWIEHKHFHSFLIHVEIIDNQVWIQCDNTEDEIADELVKKILGFFQMGSEKVKLLWLKFLNHQIQVVLV